MFVTAAVSFCLRSDLKVELWIAKTETNEHQKILVLTERFSEGDSINSHQHQRMLNR